MLAHVVTRWSYGNVFHYGLSMLNLEKIYCNACGNGCGNAYGNVLR